MMQGINDELALEDVNTLGTRTNIPHFRGISRGMWMLTTGQDFIKIVTGEIEAESGFDQFVLDWNAQGGAQIAKEILE